MTETLIEVENQDEARVDAEPTKDFFISMLTRDIDLKDAVVDLVDNSVDGARRMRPDQNFEGLWVHLATGPTAFTIADNCGGMPVDVARRYAFRFGRDTRDPQRQARSIGQFGVGMKRTLFKLGARFRVESQTTTERFVLDVVVKEWSRTKDWDFHFQELDRTTVRPETETGTTITVEPLFTDVAELVVDDEWLTELEEDLRLKHGQSIRNGIEIKVGETYVDVEALELLTSDGLRPAVVHDRFAVEGAVKEQDAGYDSGAEESAGDDSGAEGSTDGEGEAQVDRTVEVRLVAGVGTNSRQYAGWYVYCNGRLVLGPDKTRTTAWGVRSPSRIPIYHDQFRRFRGYAFFECDDPSRLPWTTTKTGVDSDNAIWKASRAKMITMTRPVIDFLNLLDKQNTAAGGAEAAAAEPTGPPEGDQPSEERIEYAERTLASAASSPVGELALTESSFVSPEIDSSQFVDAPVRISFTRDKADVDSVREYLGPDEDGKTRTNGELGEEAWDYYWRNEIQL